MVLLPEVSGVVVVTQGRACVGWGDGCCPIAKEAVRAVRIRSEIVVFMVAQS